MEDKLREGRVEVMENGSWVSVCGDNLKPYTANVICRQLGFHSWNDSRIAAYFGEGTSDVILNDIVCYGTENNIAECTIDYGPTSCGHDRDAGVICNGM